MWPINFENKTKLSISQYVILQVINNTSFIDATRLLSILMILQSRNLELGLKYTYRKDFENSISCREASKDLAFLIKNNFIKTGSSKNKITGQREPFLKISLSEFNKKNIFQNKEINSIMYEYSHLSSEELGLWVYDVLNAANKAFGQEISLKPLEKGKKYDSKAND